MLNIYRASAGSGKTYRLTQDYIHLLFNPRKEKSYRRILAVTFTNKATDEMKSRILKELYALSQSEASNYRKGLMTAFNMSEEEVNEHAKSILITILHDYSAFSISTIDRFFQQVIRSFARDIGVHGGYNLELDTSQTLEQSVDNLFFDLSKDENKQLLRWLTQFAEERIEQSESWNMRKNIIDLGYEIFKENYQHKAEDTNRKLHEREFLENYRKSLRSIIVSFEEKVKVAAQKGLFLMEKHGLTHEDFAYSTTRTFESLVRGKLEIGKRFTAYIDDVSNCYAKSKPQHIKNAIETAYDNGLKLCVIEIVEMFQFDIAAYNSAQIVLKHINTLGILSDLAVQIKKMTDEQNTMLISDTNLLLNKIIDNSDMPFVYEKTGLHIDHFMIDEFQDTSVLQWKNFHPLVSNSLAAGNTNLVVGDVKQSIYRWRNSDWKLLDEQIMHDFRIDQIHEENLDINWRSDRHIIEFNNAFFYHASQILQQKLNENVESELSINPALKSLMHKITHAYENISQELSPRAKSGQVQIHFIEEEEADDGWKVASLERLPALLEELQDRGYQPADIAVLVRKNDEEQAVIHRMLNYKTTPEAKTGYCYNMMGNEGLLIGSAASVRFLLAVLRLFINPDDTIQQTIAVFEYSCGRMAKTPEEALNNCFARTGEGDSLFSSLLLPEEGMQLQQLQHHSLFEMVEQIISLFQVGGWHNEAIFVQAFQNVVYQFATGKNADLNSFLTWWDKSGRKQCIATPDNQHAFRIMTIHKSKGLDFKVVILPFCDWDLDSRMRNVLWCEPQHPPFNELPLLPVEYSSRLKQSIFSGDYYNEQMHQYIDNLNVAYVAFTRAKHELICFSPKPRKEPDGLDKINSLSLLLYACFQFKAKLPTAGLISLSTAFDKESGVFQLGETVIQQPNDSMMDYQHDVLSDYPSVSSSDRLRIRRQSTDMWLQDQRLTDSRLNYGLIMHDVLCMINSRRDQDYAINEFIRSGRISIEEGAYIHDELAHFWEMTETASWFAPDVKVLNEAAILTPTGEQFRPDRVIIKDKEAIVVDYKFGDSEKKQYLVQVKGYMNLISQMGYNVCGYVCYVSLHKVILVD